ncbi:MAG TPA: hypothetical protein VJS88_05060, partial [Chthoniobacterales bacterium]|nr:hypothetical protein [Chthoniobacterales bacterium]
MRNPPLVRLAAATLLFAAAATRLWGSDHADPMSLNVLALQPDQEANITDLHAFVVDKSGQLITDPGRIAEADRLVISLCVRRALQPNQIKLLNLAGYKFRVHLDLNPKVRFFPEDGTPDGAAYARQLDERNKAVAAKAAALEEAKKTGDAARSAVAQLEWQGAVNVRGALIGAHESDHSMQALYGGIIMDPDSIAEDAILEFELGLKENGENSETYFSSDPRITGIPGSVRVIRPGREAEMQNSPPGTIHVETDIFDDPFIFPRFFRRNVVGIVTTIPLASLQQQGGRGPILLWATTHRTGQIDHVGRSLRTQLPRFGYLNTKHPRDHVNAINEVHDRPTVMDDILATFLSPLEAHRHYDSVPDVMVYDLRKPAKFPNGRALADDVAQALAAAGETLLVELSYAESKQFPRATTNDKPFRPDFPYLAPRWTNSEIAASSAIGATLGTFPIPRPAEASAIAAPNFKLSTWRTLWRIETITLVVLAVLLLFSVRTWGARIVAVILALLALRCLYFIQAEPIVAGMPGAMEQPNQKLLRVVAGAAYILAFLLALFFNWGRRTCRIWPATPMVYPEGEEGLTLEDTRSSSFAEIDDALFNPERNRQYYRTWRGPGDPALPIYKQTFTSITRGIIVRFWRDFAMLSAARRTVRSRADLRWGADGKGFRRLVHGMGICLKGKWEIDPNWSCATYTGYFAPGASGRVIARYSLGGNDPRNGRNRSLGLVGKLFPERDDSQGKTPRANFITQEDLGGAFTNSVVEVDLTNSPPVSLLKRGYGVFSFIAITLALLRADKQPAERQLYEIAELEKPDAVPTSCPRFMRLQLIDATPPPQPNELDFRDE